MRLLVSGASGGLGSALAALARERGDQVIAVSRTAPTAPVDAHVPCDVRDYRCLAEGLRPHGPIDGVAALHGHGDPALWKKPVAELTADDLLEPFTVDVVGSLNLVKAALPHLAPNASIVLASSTPALVGDTYGIPYAVAKAGLIALARSLAKALAPIRVNAVAFGPMETRWTRWITKEELEAYRGRTVLRRLGSPREAAEAVYWLLSPASGYVTGHVLVVDGGESL